MPAARPSSPAVAARAPLEALHARLWRGSSLSPSAEPTRPSGFAALDAELPGGGWPTRAIVELIAPQLGVLEWRLLAPGLRDRWCAPGATPPALLLVNPPHTPHLPGLLAQGLPAALLNQGLIWVTPGTPAQQLWATEQAIKSRIAVLAWLPEARPEQIRRLQVAALGSDEPIFLLRPWAAQTQSSAAPLRLLLQPGPLSSGGATLGVHLLKRRGPMHEGWLQLPALPATLDAVLTPRMRAPSEPMQPARPTPSPSAQLARATPTESAPHAMARAAMLDGSPAR